jgi:hypothetical protein
MCLTELADEAYFMDGDGVGRPCLPLTALTMVIVRKVAART